MIRMGVARSGELFFTRLTPIPDKRKCLMPKKQTNDAMKNNRRQSMGLSSRLHGPLPSASFITFVPKPLCPCAFVPLYKVEPCQV